MRTREVLAGTLTDKCPKLYDLIDRLPNRSAYVFGTQNVLYPIDTTSYDVTHVTVPALARRCEASLNSVLWVVT